MSDGTHIVSQPSLGPTSLKLEYRPRRDGSLPAPETVRVNVGVLLDERLRPILESIARIEAEAASDRALVERILESALGRIETKLLTLEIALVAVPGAAQVESVLADLQVLRQMVAGVAVNLEQAGQDAASREESARAHNGALHARLDGVEQRFGTVFSRLDGLERDSFGAVVRRLWRRVWRR